jgi:hypothetical protein
VPSPPTWATEGIVLELSGNVDGPYPVGRRRQVLVGEGDLALAREVVAEQRAARPDAAGGATDDRTVSVSDAPRRRPNAARDTVARAVAVLALKALAARCVARPLCSSRPGPRARLQPSASPAAGVRRRSGVALASRQPVASGTSAAAPA